MRSEWTDKETKGNITQTESKKWKNSLSHTETTIENGAPTYKDNKRPNLTNRSNTRQLKQEEKVGKTKKKGLFLRKGVQDRSR